MKKFFFLFLLCGFSVFAQEKDRTLADGMNPMFYKKRTTPILNIALVYYGDFYNEADLARVQTMLEERFFASTDQALKLNIMVSAIIPFKNNILDFPDYRQDYVTDITRLQRLWYYDNVGAKILTEVYEQAKLHPEIKLQLNDLDALAIITGAQFDGLGFASGRVAVTENPMEIAWGLPDGGLVEFITDARVVDELTHEIGHAMFLDHAASHCSLPGMSYQESMACCALSPAKNDVMSYCRDRNSVNENHFYKYEACNLRIIREKIIPAMLSGGAWNVANREKCL